MEFFAAVPLIDEISAHPYDLSRADFEHILGTFPLVFLDDDARRRKRESLLETYDQWRGWFNR